MDSASEHSKGDSHTNGKAFFNRNLDGTQNGASRTQPLNVLVVGAGFGGLATAIECQRQGHTVSIYESFSEFKPLGDLISFGSNAGRIFRRWVKPSGARVSDLLEPSSIRLEKNGFNLCKWNGENIMTQRLPPADPEAPTFTGHRGAFHQTVFEYAQELGIPIHLNCRVKRYFEDTHGAGIELESGSITADVVIAADGVRSKARETVLGYLDHPKPSGHTALRAWFTNEEIQKDPALSHLCDGDTFTGWIGKGVHFLFSSISHRGHCAWSLTFSDEVKAQRPITESKLEKVVSVFAGWDPICRQIISKTPEEKIIEWDLVQRDPLPTWISSNGRIALLGDSAHPFLPTSAQGATQAMEDAVTLAICLRESKTDVPIGLRAFQSIRYDRVAAVQKTGETTRAMWHKADWDKAKTDPKSFSFPREDWIHGHDAEKHAEEVVTSHLG